MYTAVFKMLMVHVIRVTLEDNILHNHRFRKCSETVLVSCKDTAENTRS